MRYFIGLIAVSLLLSWAIRSALPSYFMPASRTADRSDACAMSQTFVKRQLKAPTTAKFPLWTQENCRATQNGHTWKVRSYVDAQNGFGAMIRSDYGVEMIYNPSTDSWTLVDIVIVNP